MLDNRGILSDRARGILFWFTIGMIALIAIVAILSLIFLGDSIGDLMSYIGATIDDAT